MDSVNWFASCIGVGGGCTGAGNVYSKGENGGCTGMHMGASSSTRFLLSFIPLLINQSLWYIRTVEGCAAIKAINDCTYLYHDTSLSSTCCSVLNGSYNCGRTKH